MPQAVERGQSYVEGMIQGFVFLKAHEMLDSIPIIHPNYFAIWFMWINDFFVGVVVDHPGCCIILIIM